MSLSRDDQITTLTEAQAKVTHPDSITETQPRRGWPEGDHKIVIGEARDMVDRYRRAVQRSGGAFKKSALERLLSQTGCVGMRIYYGMHPDGQPALILVGVDENGEELLDGELLENNFPCPPFCPKGPSLRHARS